MINSPHAYEQNKAFTKHIVHAMMKDFEEKLELEVSIPRKLHDEWEPTIKVKINNYGNSYGNPSYNNNRNTSDLENNIKEFINHQKVFNTTIEENLKKS